MPVLEGAGNDGRPFEGAAIPTLLPNDTDEFARDRRKLDDWWYNPSNQLDEVSTYLGEGELGYEYKVLAMEAAVGNWSTERMWAAAEKRGLFQYIVDGLNHFSNPPSPPGSRGFNGSGGGGAVDEEARANAIASMDAAIRNQARTLGIAFSNDQIFSLAAEAVDGRWSGDLITDKLIAAHEWATGSEGRLTAAVDDIKALAARFLISVSDETARDLSLRLNSDELDLAGIRSMYAAQARTQFGFLADDIDQGVTPADFFAPLRDALAGTLEVNAADLDLMDSSVQDMLTVRNEDGTTRAASFTEVEYAARRDSRFIDTRRAQDQTAAMTRMVADAFGGL